MAKRKHEGEGKEEDPSPAITTTAPTTAEVDADTSFAAFGLDPRLLQGITKQNFSYPTLVQAKAIPLALEGKDILARAKTGSGKTAAYLLPVLQAILKRKETSEEKFTSALILVPTRELAQQVHKVIESLAAYCGKHIRSINLAQNISEKVQQSLLSEKQDIIVSTPSRALAHINISKSLTSQLTHLVIDEADLVLSYGYEDDLQGVSKALPKGLQTFLMSATLTTEVETLKSLFCRNPAILRLEEDVDAEGEGVTQYCVKCSEDEKFLLLYVIFKLKLIKGKTIIFVGDIDRSYRVKLFLEQFGIRSCVLNSELPVNSRLHIVEEFNKNVYEIIIASDENEVLGDEEYDGDNNISATKPTTSEGQAESEPAPKPKKKKKTKNRKDKEYGISRGLDFQNLACVLNFDLPTTSKSYTHRIGRTARAHKNGISLSFVIPTNLFGKHKPTTHASCANDEKILQRIRKSQAKLGKEIKPYVFDMAQVDAFRYRMDDALRAVTKVAVREARMRELRNELVKSERLKRHFEENPGDLLALRHDGESGQVRVQAHLRHVPEYLLPKGGKSGVLKQGERAPVVHVGLRKVRENRIRKARQKKTGRGGGRDPVKMYRGGKR
ncbi:DEAD-domain-containing protein [Choiromyces venosus 120613-1]|uniref:RNA helicase n=1 Tax=Choiromyces venosus 120613-1 TaxID=1336337 RepID=A0A3N4JYN3_9PEZI|nr:DEAD-domain-containing protein [Choiromyces venosus 120613-1]